MQLYYYGALKIEASEDWLFFIKDNNIVSGGQMVDIGAKLRGLGKTWAVAQSHCIDWPKKLRYLKTETKVIIASDQKGHLISLEKKITIQFENKRRWGRGEIKVHSWYEDSDVRNTVMCPQRILMSSW